MEKRDILVTSARRWADLTIWLSLISVTVNASRDGGEENYRPVRDGWYLMNDYDCPHQTGHTDFGVWEDWYPAFVLNSGTETISPLVHHVLHINVQYSAAWKSFEELLCLNVTVPSFTLFAGHAHLWH